jgi:hypothetical protein
MRRRRICISIGRSIASAKERPPAQRALERPCLGAGQTVSRGTGERPPARLASLSTKGLGGVDNRGEALRLDRPIEGDRWQVNVEA